MSHYVVFALLSMLCPVCARVAYDVYAVSPCPIHVSFGLFYIFLVRGEDGATLWECVAEVRPSRKGGETMVQLTLHTKDKLGGSEDGP